MTDQRPHGDVPIPQAELIGKRVDVTPLFQKAGIETDPIEIIETPGMYPYKEKIEDNWAYYTAKGLQRLKEIFDQEGKQVKDIGIVGICSGVEGIAVVQVFRDTLKKLIVTDIDNEILGGTVTNIGNSDKKTNTEVIPLVGSFCEPIEAASIQVDFVHANIPNLPARGGENLTLGAEKGTFLPSQLYDKYNPPKEFVGWALAAQYAYLQSAKRVVPQGGSIITELGGRVPFEQIRKLFNATGLKMEEVITGFKEQTEALIDFEGYHQLEKEYGTAFEFYKFEESRRVLEQKGIENPTSRIEGQETKDLLAPYRVTAGQALELYKQGIAVGHTVHIFRGIK